MSNEIYKHSDASENYLEYRFISSGPMGNIQKIVQFEETSIAGIYNLSFGNIQEDGTVDHLTINDNKDRNKILVTIASTVYHFTSKYPDKWIFLTGSTPSRTRLYRIVISLNFNQLVIDFELFGLIKEGEVFVKHTFKKESEYDGFLIKRKSIKFVL